MVVIRRRGRSDLGTTFMDVLRRYAVALRAVGSKLVLVSANERIRNQLEVNGVLDVIGAANVHAGTERIGAALGHAVDEAQAWIRAQVEEPGPDSGLSSP